MKPLPFRLTSVAAILLVIGLVKLPAQEVTVTRPVQFEHDVDTTASDKLPVISSKWLPEYPKEKLKSGEQGYVIAALRYTPKGHRDLFRPIGTDESFARSVLAVYYELASPYNRGNGQQCAPYTWMAVIYNPASTAAGKPNATARLVRVAPVVVSLEQWNKLPNKKLSGTLLIDTKGAVKKISLDSEKTEEQSLMPEIEKAIAQWVFEPARSNGHPTESSVKTSFVFHVKYDDAIRLPTNLEWPKALKKTHAAFPMDLKNKGITGEVTIKWVVTERGDVEQASIMRSSAKDTRTEALKNARPQTIDKSTSNTSVLK